MIKAIYPGSFDPLTNGHLDIIRRATQLFDHLVVAVAINPAKKPLFSENERKEIIREVLHSESKVSVVSFHNLLVHYAREIEARVIVRGIRAISDFEYEFQMALMNRQLDPSIETVYLTPSAHYSFLSSRLVKEVAAFGGRIEGLVPPSVAARVREKYQQR